jgi:hypothetical protein
MGQKWPMTGVGTYSSGLWKLCLSFYLAFHVILGMEIALVYLLSQPNVSMQVH